MTELFANKYENLYKSVPYDKDDMCKLKQQIDDSISMEVLIDHHSHVEILTYLMSLLRDNL